MNGVPVVNLNGSPAQSLIDARMAASDAVREAMRLLSECSPNGRDYQTAPMGEYEIARTTYIDRHSFLDRMVNELQDEAIAIQEQQA